MIRGEPNHLLSLGEATGFLRVSRSKLYLLMNSGELPFVKLGKSRRISLPALLELVERNTRRASGVAREFAQQQVGGACRTQTGGLAAPDRECD